MISMLGFSVCWWAFSFCFFINDRSCSFRLTQILCFIVILSLLVETYVLQMTCLYLYVLACMHLNGELIQLVGSSKNCYLLDLDFQPFKTGLARIIDPLR